MRIRWGTALVILALCLAFGTDAYALTQDTTAVGRAPTLSTNNRGQSTVLSAGAVDVMIERHGSCRWIDNNSGDQLFVPLRTVDEWNAFVTNAPSSVRRDTCCPDRAVTLRASDGQTQTYQLGVGRNRAGHSRYEADVSANFQLSRQDCTTHCDGTTTCNTTAWVETVNESWRCTGTGWQRISVGAGNAPAVNAPAYQACPPPPPSEGAWSVGAWGACSATCGGGIQSRSVTCGFDSCTGARPAASQSCNSEACGCDVRFVPVTATCAAGGLTGSGQINVQRALNCRDEIVASQSYWTSAPGCCVPGLVNTQTRPLYGINVQGCDAAAPVGSWTTGDWGACSATCGGGTQTRAVQCVTYREQVVSDQYCSGSRPIASQACNTQACPTTGAWTVGAWSACSATCGGGTQTRNVTCGFDSCTGAAPATTQACNTNACVPLGPDCVTRPAPAAHCGDVLPNGWNGQTSSVACGVQCNKMQNYVCDSGAWAPVSGCGTLNW